MKTYEIITIVAVSGIIFFRVYDYIIWNIRHKRRMKKFREDLEENNWRKENWNKSVHP